MTNHLRIALKHLLASKETDSESSGNFIVRYQSHDAKNQVKIFHLHFNSQEIYPVCIWNINENSLNIIESGKCPEEEVLFVSRTIHKLGYEIETVLR